MKLRDLDATFVRATPNGHHRLGDNFAEAQGVLFMCPGCQNHYILVWFRGRGVPDDKTPLPRWEATGTGLDDLTLAPSINLDVPGTTGCRWHGFVRGGDAA